MSILCNCEKTFLFQAIQFSQTILIQTIQFRISIVFLPTQLNVKTILFSMSTDSVSKTVLFQTIQLSISTQFSSIWSIDKTLSGVTLKAGVDLEAMERVLRISQSSKFIVSRGLPLRGEKQEISSTPPCLNWHVPKVDR